MVGDAVKIPLSLAPTHCPDCEYSYEGLPIDAACPECGRPRDPSEIVLYGSARGTHLNAGNRKWLAFIVSSLFPLLAALQFLTHDRNNIWYLPIFAMTLVMQILMVIRRMGADKRGLIQIRLGSSGCVQYDDLGGPCAVSEWYSSFGWMIPLCSIALLFFVFFSRGLKPIWFGIWLLQMVAWMLWSCRDSYRWHKQQREARSEVRPSTRFPDIPVTSWKDISGCALSKMTAKTHVICVTGKPGKFKTSPVDAEVRCSVKQALELQLIITAWIAAAFEEPAAVLA